VQDLNGSRGRQHPCGSVGGLADRLLNLANTHKNSTRARHGPDLHAGDIDAAVAVGFRPVKLKTVVKRGVNDHALVDLARFACAGGHIVLYTCLFAAAGHDLRALLRTGASDQQLVEALAGTWAGRADRYSEQRASNTPSHTDTHQRIEMSYIGG
jgi:molybdenum cofactor biosynthesis enzyme MoaA